MRFKNYTNEAIYELEHQRTGNYGNLYEESETVCENGCINNTLYMIDKRVLCEECLIEEVRNCLIEALEKEDELTLGIQIAKDIVSDFSDSEILAYIENRYDKI